jgi:hypothetical protein
MINSKAEAEALVGACRYPPRGARSFGSNRALLYGGADYWQHANDEVLVFAMVETREAVKRAADGECRSRRCARGARPDGTGGRQDLLMYPHAPSLFRGEAV